MKLKEDFVEAGLVARENSGLNIGIVGREKMLFLFSLC